MARFSKYALSVAAASLFLAASGVRADTVDQFTYQAGASTFDWQLAPSPTALNFQFDNVGFSVLTNFTENGVATSGEIFFFPDNGGGAEIQILTALGNALADAIGPQVYSGLESAPTFLPGSYSLTDLIDPVNPIQSSLTITQVTVAPVPEPSSLLLLGSGLLLVALGLAVKKFST